MTATWNFFPNVKYCLSHFEILKILTTSQLCCTRELTNLTCHSPKIKFNLSSYLYPTVFKMLDGVLILSTYVLGINAKLLKLFNLGPRSENIEFLKFQVFIFDYFWAFKLIFGESHLKFACAM